MISQVSEKTMHVFRWVLVVAWLLLIFSLFYDPISQYLTDPKNQFSPFRDSIISFANDPTLCIKVQSECLKEQPYPMGTRIFWGMVVPSAIMTVFVLGHETWRRICPLYFLSQIPRKLGLEPRLNIRNNKWLIENHLYLQFILFFIGLNSRILFVNSARPIFGLFLILTITSAITMVYLYGGRSWCHYVCPFGIVQMVFTGPRGLLDSKANEASPESITQSMCREVDQATGKEVSACINCKSSCFDIDAEKSYWNQLHKPGRKLVQYGYLGLATGYFIYYFLYAGNFDYYFSGAWSHDDNQLNDLLKPGFYISGQAISIPKLMAVPLTLGFCVGMSYLICNKLEKIYRTYVKRKNLSISQDVILHRVFSVCTFIAFNIFFIYGGRPEILRLPIPIQFIFNSFVVLVSALWVYRTWDRSHKKYTKESNAGALRRQLKKLPLNFEQSLKGRSLDEMKPDELEVLVSVLPNVTEQNRLQLYKDILKELLSTSIKADNSFQMLQLLRQKLNINDNEHFQILNTQLIEEPMFLNSDQESSREELLRLESYCKQLNFLLSDLLASKMPLEEAFALKSEQILAIKRLYRITPEENSRILGKLFHENSELRRKAEALLVQLQVSSTQTQVLNYLVQKYPDTIFVLLRSRILVQLEFFTIELLKILEVLSDEAEIIQLAGRLGILAYPVLPTILQHNSAKWQKRLSPQVINLLSTDDSQTQLVETSRRSEAVIDVLTQLMQQPDSVTQAAALYALYKFNPEKAYQHSQDLLSNQSLDGLSKYSAKIIVEQSPELLETLSVQLAEAMEIKNA